TVLGFTFGLILLTSALFGIVSVWRASNLAVTTTLWHGARGEFSRRGRLRNSAIVIEVALAMVLLVCAGLLGRSLAYLHAVNSGFSDQNVRPVNSVPAGAAYETDPQQVAYFAKVQAAVRDVPGVRAATVIDFLPIAGSGAGSEVRRMDESLRDRGHGTL